MPAQASGAAPGRSLLPVGVVQVSGTFGKGDVVALFDPDGVEFARGLTNYSSTDAVKICGLRTEQIAEVLADHSLRGDGASGQSGGDCVRSRAA